MSNIIQQFNTIVEDLLVQTTNLVGTKYLFNYRMMVRMNVIAPIERFTTSMLYYKDEINNKNINFFINKDIDCSKYNTINNNDIFDLKNIFLNIDKESQENIWQILQALIILSEKRLEMKNPSR